MQNKMGRKKQWFSNMDSVQVIGTLASKAAAVVESIQKGNKENARLNYVAFDNMYNSVLPAIASVKEYSGRVTYNDWKNTQLELGVMKSKLVNEIRKAVF